MLKEINEAYQNALKNKIISRQEALKFLSLEPPECFYLYAAANALRDKFKGDKIKLCGIINAKSGRCPEDCIFCAQSKWHNSKIETYPLKSKKEIMQNALAAKKAQAGWFGIVTSGRGVVSDREIDKICETVRDVKDKIGIKACVAIGIVQKEQIKKLKAAGIDSFNMNLETSENFFPQICSTHTYKDKLKTIEALKKEGVHVCCGGIFGLGESLEDRVDLAFKLKSLDITSVNLNFLHPIEGTPGEKLPPLAPIECLNIIAVYRFILPRADIRVCGGREKNLRSLQPLIFIAGANATMLGNYLTTQGRPASEDIEMLKDLCLKEEC